MGLLFGASGLMVRVGPVEKRTAWLSGAQARLYTGLLWVARVERSIPARDQTCHNTTQFYTPEPSVDSTRTAPSSPPVTMPAPSPLQRAASTAPLCASTGFSILPARPTSCSLPSAELTRNMSPAPPPPFFPPPELRGSLADGAIEL